MRCVLACVISIAGCGRLGFDPLASDPAPPEEAGFAVSIVAQSDLLIDRDLRIAIPPATSAFPAGVYVAAGGLGAPPIVVRARHGVFETFAISDGIAGPDEGVAQIAFAPAPYGDRLFLCAASVDGGDGMFTLDSAGAFASWSAFNNCNGLAFDDARVLDDPGFSPLYVNVNAESIDRFSPASDRSTLVDDLAFGSTGWKLYLHAGSAFERGLYLVFPVDAADDPARGAIWFAPPGMPLAAAPFLELAGPYAIAFGNGPFGDTLYVSSSLAGTIEGIRPDGSRFTVLEDLAGEVDLAFAGDTLYAAEQGTGRLLAITAR